MADTSNPTTTPAPARRKSPFLVFEGLDGSGKSTLIHLVAEELKTRDIEHTLTREPGGTPLAEEIRKLLLRTEKEAPVGTTELLLYAASRSQHVAKVIRPAIDRGTWILCDRFLASSVAFQCFARGLPRPDIDWLNTFAIQGMRPDLTILLDLTVELSAHRQADRSNKDRMEAESRAFHEAVRQGYLVQAKEDAANWLVLDARQTPEVLKTKVIEMLEKRRWLASSTN